MAINIFGEIGFDVTAKEVFDLIQEEKAEEINVIISSGGGSAFEGLMIFDALKATGKKINTQILGLGASAASVIFMAGDNREMGEGSLLMVHNSWSMFMGNAKEVREQLGTLDAIDSRMTSIFTKATGLDEAKVIELLKDETFMASDEAVDLGFATGEIEVLAKELNVLNKAKPLPLDLDNPDTTEEIRLKYRYLDLRRPEMQKKLILRSKAAVAVREYFDKEDFIKEKIVSPWLKIILDDLIGKEFENFKKEDGLSARTFYARASTWENIKKELEQLKYAKDKEIKEIFELKF